MDEGLGTATAGSGPGCDILGTSRHQSSTSAVNCSVFWAAWYQSPIPEATHDVGSPMLLPM